MTEPPEPRRPEEGGGEDDELQDFLDSEQFAELGDDMLLDRIGRGEDDRTISDDMPDEEWELQDLLHDWKDDVEDVPVPPIAERAQEIHTLNQQFNTPTQGVAPTMMSESIAALNQVAEDTSAAGPIQEAQGTLEGSVLNSLQQAVARITELSGQATSATEGNAGDAGEIQSTAEHAANAVEEAIEAVQAATAAVSLAFQHEAMFRQTAGGIAQKYAGG